jgi:hypothetical protein
VRQNPDTHHEETGQETKTITTGASVKHMRGKLYVVYASVAGNLLDAEILLTTDDRQAAIAQAQGGIVYAYD